MSERGEIAPGRTHWVYRVTKAIASVYFCIYFRLKVYGVENVPADGPVILAANHTSFLDPPLTAVGLSRSLRFVARKTLWGKNCFWDWFLYSCNAFPVDQDRPDVGSFKVMLRFLHAGEALVLYPEGSRSWDGTFLEPKTGVARLACRTGVRVVPVYIEGAYKALPRGAKVMRPCPIRVFYGEPVLLDAGPGEDKNAHYAAVSTQIMEKIGALVE